MQETRSRFEAGQWYLQDEPPNKRPRIEENPVSYFGVDALTSAGIPISSLVNSDPQWSIQPEYQQPFSYQESWPAQVQGDFAQQFGQFYDPAVASGPEFPFEDTPSSSGFEGPNYWTQQSSYESSFEPLHELFEQLSSRPENSVTVVSRVETLGTTANDGDICYGMVCITQELKGY